MHISRRIRLAFAFNTVLNRFWFSLCECPVNARILLNKLGGMCSSGYDGFRVRTSAYRPPTGYETSFLYDPPLEGPENSKPRGLSFDTHLNGTQPGIIRNGNMLFKTSGLSGRNYGLSFYRIEANGTETLILNEYNPGKRCSVRT